MGEAGAMGTRFETKSGMDGARWFRAKRDRYRTIKGRTERGQKLINDFDRQKIVNFTNYACMLTATSGVLLLAL
jgi:hypothetical protein